MLIQLNPTVPLETPKGRGDAHFLIDYGQEHFLLFVCFVNATGECWTFRNDQVRLQKNPTMRPVGETVVSGAAGSNER